jgi:ELWxxDGT repeat protein
MPDLFVSGNYRGVWAVDSTDGSFERLSDDLESGIFFTPIGDGRFLFQGSTATTGRELWVTDGTASGTEILRDTAQGTDGAAYNITPVGNGQFFYVASDRATGSETYITDGTPEGTRLLADVAPGRTSSITNFSGAYIPIEDGRIVFAAADFTFGPRSLRITDGTSAGTTELDYDPFFRSNDTILSLFPTEDGRVLFVAASTWDATAIAITDGTRDGTEALHLFEENSYVSMIPLENGQIYASVSFSNGGYDDFEVTGSEFWRIGLNGDSVLLSNDFVFNITAFDTDRAVFSSRTTTEGNELWITDGTRDGTTLLRDIDPGTASGLSGIADFTPLADGLMVFAANDGVSGRELWVTDGTTAGTTVLRDTNEGAASALETDAHITSLGDGRAVFVADDGTYGSELWVTDGTQTGTRLVQDITVGVQGSNFFELEELGEGLAYFHVGVTRDRSELWLTDGTAGGTRLLAEDGPWGSRADVFRLPDVQQLEIETIEGDDIISTAEAQNGIEISGTSDPDAVIRGTLGAISSMTVADADGSWHVTLGPDSLPSQNSVFMADILNVQGDSIWSETRPLTFTTGRFDAFTGTADADVIHGFGGNDTLRGAEGDDRIVGGDGNDVIAGNGGQDLVLGGDGTDLVFGGSDDDRIAGNSGNDTMRGGFGEDSLWGGGDNDLMAGNSGNDLLRGGLGNDNLWGGSGNDLLAGNTGNDTLRGGEGNDQMHGGDGNDVVSGNNGHDVVRGGDGLDVLFGGGDNDRLAGNSDNDTLRGGFGDDSLWGGTGDDVLAGNEGNDLLSAGLGNDKLFGGSGNDVLNGDAGSDILSGGSGADVFVFATISHSPHGPDNDTIKDFQNGMDQIDLSGFGGLTFVGAAYTGGSNEVRFNGDIGRLYIDVDGDRASDFSIDFIGVTAISNADLIL